MAGKRRQKRGKGGGHGGGRFGLRLVALFEGGKGLLVLAVGGGLLLLLHRDLHQAAAQLVSHLHFNPSQASPRIFLDLADKLDDGKLWALASGALLYSLVRFAEAVGLWLGRSWAAWFGLLTTSLYLPLELYELSLGVSWAKLAVVAVNLLVATCLLYQLATRKVG